MPVGARPLDGFGRRASWLAWNYVDLDEDVTLLSFERPALGPAFSVGRARARAHLENSIATSIPVFF